MTVKYTEHRRKDQAGFRIIAGPSKIPVSMSPPRLSVQPHPSRRRSATVTHRRTSSTISGTQIPFSPAATPYGFRPPTFGSSSQTQVPVPATSSAAVNMAPIPAGNIQYPFLTKYQPFRQNLVSDTVVRSGLHTPSQPLSTRSRAANQHPAETSILPQVIIQNLKFEVTEGTLMNLLNDSVGQVQRCKIERREDKKCHAFVTFWQPEQAERAVRKLNHCELFGRKVTVRLTKEVESRPAIVDGYIQ
ncbi:MAG: hypothetical protein Q9170_003868 [Blastenia crenularia]